jgi:hypothetical protein
MQSAQDHHALLNGNRQVPAHLPRQEGANNWYIIRRADGTLDFSQLSDGALYRLIETVARKVTRGEPLNEVEQACKDYWESDAPTTEADKVLEEAEQAGLRLLVLRWCMSYCPGTPPDPPGAGVEVPNSILVDPSLSADEKVYLSILLGHKGAKGIIPRKERLAWYLDRTGREIGRLNSDLVRKGLLKVNARHGHSNGYTVVPPKAKGKASQGYTQVPLIVLYDRMLEVGERLAFMLVAYYQRQDEWCLHSIAEMARLAGVGRRAFTAWMEELYKVGLVVQTEDRLRFGGTVGRRTGDVAHAERLVRRELEVGGGTWQTTYVFYNGRLPDINMELGEEPGEETRFWIEPDQEADRAFLKAVKRSRELDGASPAEAAEVFKEGFRPEWRGRYFDS